MSSDGSGEPRSGRMELSGRSRFRTTREDTFRLRLAELVALSKITLRRVSFQKQVLFQTVSVNGKQEAGKILKILTKVREKF